MNKKIYLSLVVLIFAFKTYAQPTCFTYTSTNYTGSTDPWYSVIADFNNDGKKDFAANNYLGASFNVYIGNGVGSFTQASGSPYSTAGNNYALTNADFNNDGNQDIIVGGTNLFQLYVGTGAGTFTTSGPTSFTGTCSGYGAIAGDWNGDGNMDVAFSNGANANAHVLIGNGAGSFSVAPGSPYLLPGNQWWVETADFNKDGIADLIYSEYTAGQVSVLLGTGTGSFVVQSPIVGVAGAAQISVGDINNDGNLDFVTCSGSATTPNIYTCMGNGTGAFATPGTYATTGINGPWGVALGDLNVDGKLDVFVSGFSSNNSAVYYGNGAGAYVPSTNSPFIISGVSQNLHPRIGDLDGDGKVDVIVPSYGTALHSVLLNRPLNVNVVSSTSVICVGQTATLTVSGATTYSWSTSATTTAIAVSPSVTTTYSVTGTTGGCAAMSAFTQSVSLCTNINSFSTSNINLEAYPNPNNGDFTLRSDVTVKLEIVNELGQAVKTVRLDESNNYQTPVSGLANGVYFISGQHDQQVYRYKIVVTK